MQGRIAFMLHFVISSTLMGVFVTAALTTGQTSARIIALAALAGFVAAIPISWVVARKVTRVTGI